MMTYRDLFVMVLSNEADINTRLKEDIHFILDGYICGFTDDGEPFKFLPEEEYAAKYGVGVATVRAWVQTDMIKRYVFDGKNYIPETEKNPMEVK